MAQVDLVSASAQGATGSPSHSKIAVDDPPPSDLPDFAPASFFLSKDAELDWLDRNAFMERKDSGKGASLHSAPNPCSSHRYCLSVKSKPSFIGLPKAAYGEPKPRRPPSIRLFPKRPSQSSKSNSGRKSDSLVADPSSPKVSCIGRVRSRRDRSLRKKNRSQKQLPDQDHHPAAIRRSRSHKTGFWSSFLSIFGSRGHRRTEDGEPAGSEPKPAAAGKLKKSRSSRKRSSLAKSKSLRKRTSGSSPSSEVADPPPSLVAVRQFTSGRRSDAWAADLEVDGATKLE